MGNTCDLERLPRKGKREHGRGEGGTHEGRLTRTWDKDGGRGSRVEDGPDPVKSMSEQPQNTGGGSRGSPNKLLS